MWSRLPRDDKHKTSPAGSVLSFWKGLASLSSLGAATRQACNLKGAGDGAKKIKTGIVNFSLSFYIQTG